MKPNEIECLAKLRATNDVSGLLLLHQHKSELAFTFPLITSEVVLFRRVLENTEETEGTEETLAFIYRR